MGHLDVLRGPRPMPSAKNVRLAFAGVGVVVVAVLFFLVDLGGTVAGSLDPAKAFVIAIWAVPFLLYVSAVRSWAASILGGLGLDAAVLLALISLFRDTHSTAGIGVLALPMLITLLAASIAVVDYLCRGWHERSTGER